MPTKDTKTITIRVQKSDYYKWLKLAAESQVPISTYLKQLLTENKAENGILIPESPGDTRKIYTASFLELKVPKDALKEIRDKSFFVKDGVVYEAKYNVLNHKWILKQYYGFYGNDAHLHFNSIISDWLYLSEKSISEKRNRYERIAFPIKIELKYKIIDSDTIEVERIN